MIESPSGAPGPSATLPIRHAEQNHRGAFFIEKDGRRAAELTYLRAANDKVIIDHTNVSESLRGQGVAQRLVLAAVSWARETHTRLVPVCPFAKTVFERDPSLRDVC